MTYKFVLFFLQTAAITKANVFTIRNNCPFTIWPGIQGNSGKPPLNSGGFKLGAHENQVLNSAPDWAGRFWARTGCDDSTNHCLTGDCGNKIQCNGAGGVPPITMVEFTLNGPFGKHFYDISYVDGFNVPVKIQPTSLPMVTNKNECRATSCPTDLNKECLPELAVSFNGSVMGCDSACHKFNTDEYCCRGAHSQPHNCQSKNWPKDYAAFFKESCPDAYSYAFDDHKQTFACPNIMTIKFDIIFCP